MNSLIFCVLFWYILLLKYPHNKKARGVKSGYLSGHSIDTLRPTYLLRYCPSSFSPSEHFCLRKTDIVGTVRNSAGILNIKDLLKDSLKSIDL